MIRYNKNNIKRIPSAHLTCTIHFTDKTHLPKVRGLRPAGCHRRGTSDTRHHMGKKSRKSETPAATATEDTAPAPPPTDATEAAEAGEPAAGAPGSTLHTPTLLTPAVPPQRRVA